MRGGIVADPVKDEQINITKGGICRIDGNISRNGPGLLVNVKCTPEVEEFIIALGTGEKVDVATCGRWWQPVPKGGPPLIAYIIQPMKPLADMPINLEGLGQPLKILDKPTGREIVNLSFLRLCGISDGAGVSFSVKGVFSLEEAKKIREQVSVGCRSFYREYIRQIDLSFQLITTDTKY